jgi:hypothetical protein
LNHRIPSNVESLIYLQRGGNYPNQEQRRLMLHGCLAMSLAGYLDLSFAQSTWPQKPSDLSYRLFPEEHLTLLLAQ